MKNKLLILIFFTLLNNSLWSQSNDYFPFKIGNENFSIGRYAYKKAVKVSEIEEKYNVINDSIIFTFNNDKRNVYISFNYGIEFKSISYSDFFDSTINSYHIENLIKDKDKVYINMFSENVNNLINKVFVFDTKNPDSNANYMFSSYPNENGQIITLKFSFNNSLIGKSNDNIYLWKNKTWEKINIPVQNYVIQTYVSEDYFYVFFSDKASNLNNSCYRTNDLSKWEKIENFTFKYGQFYLQTVYKNKIFFNQKSIFDLSSKQLIENNFLVQKFNGSNYDYSMNVCNEKLYLWDTSEFPKVKLFEYENDELHEVFAFKGNDKHYKFYYSDKFGIFDTNGIYFFDQKLILEKNKELKKENEIKIEKNKSENNNNNYSTTNYEINSDCSDKIFKSNEILSYKEHILLKLLDSDYENQICSSSKVKIADYYSQNGDKKGLHIYYFASSGKKIKDEYLDIKGRLIGQYIYDYDSQNKGKYMYTINYKREIISMRVVESKEIIYVNFDSPYPISKENALKRYKSPNITQFTDKCQPCKGSGYNRNYTQKCMLCNGAGSITHKIIKY